ncbi:MAG: Zn-dependent hydrolase [Alphaproteobacteria bacterium]|nr:Zn-dependent hydrolase [Alphaproteobacteria bacterium]
MPGQDAIPTINAGRLWDSLMEQAKIGPGRAGGLCRLALTDADCEVRTLFARWCREAGLDLRIDPLGNMFARREGRDPSLPPVAIGSHLDTQVAGGRFDGTLGVLAGIEIVRTLDDKGIVTRRPVEIINWTNEEGARFSPPMLASGAWAGVYGLDWALDRRDEAGLRFGDELARISQTGSGPLAQGHPLDAYFELHIEQGPILDAERLPVGIVSGTYAVRGMIVEVKGETAHTGPTPMDRRRNALVGAARLVAAVDDIGWAHHATGGKTTAARLVAWPNKPGILSDWAQVTVDCRHADPATADAMFAAMKHAMGEAARRARVEMRVIDEWAWGQVPFDPALIELLREQARAHGIPHRDILSQAGHDAYHVATAAPTAMIFSPCIGGVTHNEAEAIELEMTVPAVNLLLAAVIARANR